MLKADNVLLAVGAALLVVAAVLGVWTWMEIAPTRGWASVEGQVTGHRIDSRLTRTPRWGSGVLYTPVVRYEYVVEGRELHGDRVYPGTPPEWNDRADVDEMLEAYPEGRRISVHYDPRDPERAALLLEGDYSLAWTYLVLGVFFGFGGWLIRVTAPRQKRRPRRR